MKWTAVLTAACWIAPISVHAQDLDCVINPKTNTQISAGSDGLISDILVSRGDGVEVGALLVQLDDEVERFQVQLSKTRAASRIEILSQEKRLEFRQKELDRADQLSARNVASETVREDAEIEVALTELAVEEAKLAQELAEIEAQQAMAQLERRKVKSPVAGVVTEVSSSPGEYATEQTILLTVAETDPLYVEVFASFEYYDDFRTGDTHRVRLTEPLEGVFEAKVTVVDSVFDAASGTLGVRLEIPNPDGEIPAGVRCSLAAPNSN